MDSWTLQGDSYSFLRSAPRNFSLCHRDGTPNHVEIFDIINTPTQRSAISETTCLCDIFGDDIEAASLSSSPSSATLTQQQTDVEGRAVASPLVDDLNDSSGSYHTAHSSSEGEEGLEDPSEKQNFTQLQSLTQDLDLPGTTNITDCHISPDRITVSNAVLVENKTPDTLSQGEACQSLSSLADIRCSSSNSERVFSKIESRTATPSSEDRNSSLSHHTPTPEPRNCVSSSSSPSFPKKSDFRVISPEPGSICIQTTGPSPELQSNYSITPSKFLPEVIISSTDTPSSPRAEQRARISVPDLFSRYSTPDLDDHPQTPEPFSSLINDQEDINISAFQDSDFSLETTDSVSTPDLQYTSPSSLTSSAPSLGPSRQSIISEIRLNGPSPSQNRLSPSSLDRTAARSPTTSNTPVLSSAPESRTSLHSPVVSHSLSPSPGTSPVVCIDKAASPEISITSSPEIENKFESSVRELNSQEIAASPEITKITYCIVQPEVKLAPTFSQEPCLAVSPKLRDCSPIQDFPHISLVSPASEQQSEDRLTTPTQDSRYQSPLFERCQSLSPHLSSRNPSPVSPALDQPLSETPSADTTTDLTNALVGINGLTSIETAEIEDSAKPLSPYELLSEDSEVVVNKNQSASPVAQNHPSYTAVVKTTEPTNTKGGSQSSVALGFNSYPEKKQIDHCFTEGNAPPAVMNCPLPDLTLPINNRNKNTLPVHKETLDSPVNIVENPQPLFTNFSQSPKSNRTFNPNLTPKPYRRQLSGTVAPENNSNLKENMASYVKKRRTPSPPLTRFTPVHIIAPEKPYRQWQNRSRSPPQVKTSLPSANLKKVVTNTEIPQHDPVNNIQEDWFKKGQQQEMERGLQLQESTVDQELRDCGTYRQRKKEECIPEKREGWHGDVCYREEQVELSFNAKNRKGPVSRSTAVTSRDTRPGLPTVHSYSESLLTRQSKQQQTLHRLSSQPDSKSGGLGWRLQPPVNQHKSTTSGRVATNRPGRSSSSSMGSELDEADHEVKWFTDVAFSSLSSPEVDYLDMYNSSHHSSTNVSQPSTQESPAGVNTAWLSYAEFSGSTQMLDNDELALQQTSSYYSDGQDPSRCYELGSFECVDVAVEKEDTKRVRRGVPKRQIQLKRRDTESKQGESSENSSPGVAVMDNICQDTQFKQHYTPASLEDSENFEESPEVDKDQSAAESKLQKSSSFDESFSKTKLATCLIKSVLTKKMQSHELAGEEEPCGLNENISTTKLEPSRSPKPDQSDPSEGGCDANVKEEEGRKKTFGGKLSSHRPSSTNSNRSVTFSIVDSEEVVAETGSAVLSPEPKETFSDDVNDNSQTWKENDPDDSANSTAVNRSPLTGASSTGHVTITNGEQDFESTECLKQAQQDIPSSYMPKSPNSLSLSSMENKKASLSVCLTPETENKSFISDEKVEACADGKNNEDEMDDKLKGPIHKVRDVRRLVKNTYNLSFKATSAVSSHETDDALNKEEITTENSGEVIQESKGSEEVRHSETQEFNGEANDSHEINKKHLPQQKEQCAYSQPMQIEYKAVCWKEEKNKNKIATDMKNKNESKQFVTDTTTQNVNEPTGDSTSIDLQSKGKVSGFTEKHHISAHLRTDRPVLGSLPKMPSKEREVSTAIVLIRDNSRAKKSASPFHEEFPCTAPASSPGLPGTPGSSGHSVSMLLKEKGYQADIGAVVGETQNAGANKSTPSKHVNCLEIPLQTTTELHRERTISSSSSTPGSMSTPSNTDTRMITETKILEEENVASKPDSTNKIPHLPPKSSVEHPPSSKQAAKEDFEAVKRLDPTFPPRSPAVRRLKPQSIEVKTTSKEINKQDTSPSTIGNSRPQAIEVKSVAKKSQKPIVPPKPSCKFKPLDLGAMTGESQRLPPTSSKPHNEERTQTIVVSSPTIYRKIPNDSTSNYTRKVAVSSVSSLKPPPSKPPPSNVSTQASPSEPDTVTDRHQQQQPGPPSQSSRYTQRHPTVLSAPTTSSAPIIPSSGVSDATGHQPQAPAPTGATQASQTAVLDSNPLPHIGIPYPHETTTLGSSDAQPAPVSTAPGPGFIRQPYQRSLSNECSQRRDDLHFYASDDPPSYDERESFSPLRLPDLPPRSNRYQPSSRPPPCPCTSGCPSHPGLPHPHNSPHNLTPPAPTHSPGHSVHYPAAQPPLRLHHCRSDPQPVTYQPSSPKASPLGPGPPPGLYQPLHPPSACPPHPSLMHAYSADRPLQPAQHMDPRRPPVHRSPQQQAAVLTGAPYPDPGHSHSPGLPHIEPHYLCGPQSLGPSYGSEYGGDSSSIYSESSYAQTPRRVLMDPETGKYFYIEVPVQPLRKMLFDPETGQYVEVLIPQQAMSHSGLYPPPAPNYPPIHSTNMYAPAPQYMPYAAPPAQHQPPRYPEPSAATSMHPHAPGVSYRNPSGQGSKAESQSHPPVDPNYLESMYYVPTGMNASPNTTPPDYYHKHPPNLPPSGGKRS